MPTLVSLGDFQSLKKMTLMMSSRHLWELTFLRQDTLSINQGCVA